MSGDAHAEHVASCPCCQHHAAETRRKRIELNQLDLRRQIDLMPDGAAKSALLTVSYLIDAILDELPTIT